MKKESLPFTFRAFRSKPALLFLITFWVILVLLYLLCGTAADKTGPAILMGLLAFPGIIFIAMIFSGLSLIIDVDANKNEILISIILLLAQIIGFFIISGFLYYYTIKYIHFLIIRKERRQNKDEVEVE